MNGLHRQLNPHINKIIRFLVYMGRGGGAGHTFMSFVRTNGSWPRFSSVHDEKFCVMKIFKNLTIIAHNFLATRTRKIDPIILLRHKILHERDPRSVEGKKNSFLK